jgi:hypothetical protein
MNRISQGDPFKGFVTSAGKTLATLSRELLIETFSFLFASVHLGASFAKGSLGELLTPRNEDKNIKPVKRVLKKTLDSLEAGFKRSSRNWKKFLTKRERAAFKRGTLALAVVGTGVILNTSFVDKKPEIPQWPDPNRRGFGLDVKRNPESATFEKFKNPKQVLFLTVGEDSAKGFVRAYRRDENVDFLSTRGPLISGLFITSNENKVKFIFVDISKINQQKLSNYLKQHNITPYFQAIFYRGHSYEMDRLVKYGARFEDKFCFTMMGGCNSYGFINIFHTPETPTAGVDGTGYGARNSYWNVLAVHGLSDPSVNSWGDLTRYIEQRSPIARTELVMPETDKYRASMESSKP